MRMSLRKSRYYSWVSIPAEPAPVCTFPSFWTSKDSHLACNKVLLYFPCKPNTLTSLGVRLVYGLRIWPFICTQLSRSLFPVPLPALPPPTPPPPPRPRLRSKQQVPQFYFLSSYLWFVCSQSYLIATRYQGASHSVLFRHSFFFVKLEIAQFCIFGQLSCSVLQLQK